MDTLRITYLELLDYRLHFCEHFYRLWQSPQYNTVIFMLGMKMKNNKHTIKIHLLHIYFCDRRYLMKSAGQPESSWQSSSLTSFRNLTAWSMMGFHCATLSLHTLAYPWPGIMCLNNELIHNLKQVINYFKFIGLKLDCTNFTVLLSFMIYIFFSDHMKLPVIKKLLWRFKENIRQTILL